MSRPFPLSGGQRAGPALNLLAGALMAALAGNAQAAPTVVSYGGRNLDYTVQAGDTLHQVTGRLLENPDDWAELGRLNQVTNPRRIPVGKHLLIPVELLKSRPSDATVMAVSGNASVDGRPLAVGQAIGEASWVQTDADAVVMLRLRDGSTLKIAPSSRLRFERLRQYHEENVVEARVQLDRGRIETQAAPNRRKPLEIRTPFAVAAVRGTQYRVGAEGQLAATEVLEGAVAWTGNAAQPGTAGAGSRVERGYGAAADAVRGALAPEPLLPAPALSGVPARTDQTEPEIHFEPVSGARAYRLQVSRDANFDSMLAQSLLPEPRARVTSSSDGIHYLRIRPVAASGVEGYDATASIDVQARPQPPAPSAPRSGTVLFEDVAAISWSAAPGVGTYQVQVAADADFTRILEDRRVEALGAQIIIAVRGESSADRWWRVASVDTGSGRLGPWGPMRQLQWRATPSTPEITERQFDSMTLQLPAPAGLSQQIELTPAEAGLAARTIDTRDTSLRVTGLSPGVWQVRRRTVDAAGLTSPWSAPVSIELPHIVAAGSTPLRAGDGTAVELQPR